ncbi:MAG: universal stress protein [Acidobacteriota bacterium]|nr:universal stress protein [Acidobacteriota bacterium]
MQFHHILFPVDFSDRAHSCAPHIRALSQRFGAKLTLIHALEAPRPWFAGMEAPVVPEIDYQRLEAEAEVRLEDFASAEFPRQKVAAKVEWGEPASVIEEFVNKNGVDLIAMPTHGRGIFRAALLGSVTSKILHDVKCAVWTDAHVEGPVKGQPAWNSILCAIDLSPESAHMMEEAASLKRQFGSTVRLVHAVPGPEAGLERYFDGEFQLFLENSARKSIADLQRDAGTDFEICLATGSPGRVVAYAAEHHQADLVIIGRGHLRSAVARLRTHAHSIIQNAGCPVLSI